MGKLLEFDTIKEIEEIGETKIVKYSFEIDIIREIVQTYVEYKGEYLDAVVVTFSEGNFITPPLLIHYKKFKRLINENKKNIKTRQRRVLSKTPFYN